MKNYSPAALLSEKVVQNNSNNSDQVTIAERVNLTKNQYEVLNIICNTYEEFVSQYVQEALVEGNFCDMLLDKVVDQKGEGKNKEKDNNTPPADKDLDYSLQF